MKTKRALLLSILLTPILLFGQNRHISIGIKGNGICLGNSEKYNGLRINLRDKNVHEVNGLSLAGQTKSQKINGISIGLLATLDAISNGIQIGGLLASSDKINGIAISPGLTAHEKVNGIAISGIYTFFGTTNGIQFSLFGTTPFDFIGSKTINGLAVAGIVFYCENVNGVSIASILCGSNKLNGVSIACFNATNELHGFQFGIFNYAGNNRKLFRRMPIINFNLRNKNIQ